MTKPRSLDPLAEEILSRLSEHPEASEIVLGGYFALQHYADYRRTHDIDAWWRSAASLPAEEAIRTVMTGVAKEHGFLFRERRFGDTVSFEIQVGNDGLFDSAPTVVDTLPAGLTFVEATADREMTLSQNGNLITMDFAAPLGRNEGLTIQITTTIDIGFSGSGITNSAAVSGLALDVPGNNSDTATILMGDSAPVYLPVLMKP